MKNSFTNQKPRIATSIDCSGPWGGQRNGKRFRCYLCGHKFNVGEYWRFIFDSVNGNFITCLNCDGSKIQEKWEKKNKEFEKIKEEFWAFFHDET